MRSATYPVNMPARMAKAATDTAFQNCDCLDSITALPCIHAKAPSPAHREKGAEARKFNERGFHRNAVRFLYPSEIYVSRYRALLIDRTLERSGQCAGVEGSEDGRQVCLLGFSHTMNQVKVSASDGSHAGNTFNQSLLERLTLFMAKKTHSIRHL